MQYNVARGLREIVAPRQTTPSGEWARIKAEFGHCGVYCGSAASDSNRGVVPDHLIPVTQFGELVAGNTVPACQTCNDSRGDRAWRDFLRASFPDKAQARIEKLEAHLVAHPYEAISPATALSPDRIMRLVVASLSPTICANSARVSGRSDATISSASIVFSCLITDFSEPMDQGFISRCSSPKNA
ncbi:HNH endonuclease [Cupriavidus pauculus]|uniref:HNH endonuclease n=1 Tax=Cupriavidus pauculus TaxID=82633 RepID=UPI0011AED0C5